MQSTERPYFNGLSDRRQTPDRLYDRPGVSFAFSFFRNFVSKFTENGILSVEKAAKMQKIIKIRQKGLSHIN